MEKIFNSTSIILGIVGGFVITALGGWDGLTITFIALVILDYITGILKGVYIKKLSSTQGFKGIIKKVLILIVVGIAVLLQEQIGIPAIREIVITFFIANEGISILENVAQMGIKLPNKLKEVLLQLRDKGE